MRVGHVGQFQIYDRCRDWRRFHRVRQLVKLRQLALRMDPEFREVQSSEFIRAYNRDFVRFEGVRGKLPIFVRPCAKTPLQRFVGRLYISRTVADPRGCPNEDTMGASILVWAPSRVCNSPTRAIPLSSRLRLRRQMMSAAERAKARPATTCARHARRLPTGSSLPIARALAPHLPLGCAHDPKAKGRPLRPSPPPSAPCAPQPSLSLAHAHSSLPLLRGTHPGIIRPRKAESCRYSGPHGHKNIYISHSCHPDRVPF